MGSTKSVLMLNKDDIYERQIQCKSTGIDWNYWHGWWFWLTHRYRAKPDRRNFLDQETYEAALLGYRDARGQEELELSWA